MCHNPVLHARTKYIELHIHFQLNIINDHSLTLNNEGDKSKIKIRMHGVPTSVIKTTFMKIYLLI